jgi:hypothetical protein
MPGNLDAGKHIGQEAGDNSWKACKPESIRARKLGGDHAGKLKE